MWKQKRILQQEIENCKKNINVGKKNLQKMVYQQGYKDIETFLKVYSENKKAVEQWKKEEYTEKESVVKRLKKLKKETNLYKQNIERHKNIAR